MPQYYPIPNNWRGRGKFKVTHIPFWRNIPIIRELILYRSGEQVLFVLSSDVRNQDNTCTERHGIYEYHNGICIGSHWVDYPDNAYRGSDLTPGSWAYYLGYDPRKGGHRGEVENLILTMQVLENKFSWKRFLIGCFIGALISIPVIVMLSR